MLVEQFIRGLDSRKYELLSPATRPERSTLIFISHRDAAQNAEVYQKLAAAGVDVAFRKGKLRLAPHLYNTRSDIDTALSVLNNF
jgi:selenocysteine lyase/cysteine desulfurase